MLRKNKFKVNDTAYFVYANGDTSKEEFADKLEFDTRIIPYEGDSGWVEQVLKDIKKCLDSNKIPAEGEDCDFCAYRDAVGKHLPNN